MAAISRIVFQCFSAPIQGVKLQCWRSRMQACRKTIRQPNPTRSWSCTSRPSLHSVTNENRLTAADEQLGFSLGSLMRFLVSVSC
jgi:hypothetical protein